MMKRLSVCIICTIFFSTIAITSCKGDKVDFSKIEGAWKSENESWTLVIKSDEITHGYINIFSTKKGVSYRPSENSWYNKKDGFIEILDENEQVDNIIKPLSNGKLLLAAKIDGNIPMIKTSVADIERIKSEYQNRKKPKPVTNFVPWK